MCDCFSKECSFCDSNVETHIADYCVPRENVKVVCHECLGNGLDIKLDGWYLIDESTIEREGQVWVGRFGDVFDIGEIGKKVRYYSCDPRAYGVHIN